MGCSVLLDGLEEGGKLELGEHDGLVAKEYTGQANDHETVNVGEWEKSQRDVLAWSSFRSLSSATGLRVQFHLDNIRDAVPMGDHDAFLWLG